MEGDRVDLYDTALGTHIDGIREADTFFLFDQTSQRRIDLRMVTPGFFVGFDYASHRGFEISATSSGEVRLLDHERGRWQVFST